MRLPVKVVENLKEALDVIWIKPTVVSKTFSVFSRIVELKVFPIIIDQSTTMTVACLYTDIRRLSVSHKIEKTRIANPSIDVHGKSEDYRVVWSV